jgi:5-methyltetrahydrofolate--homocysteine methyltransferase
VREGLLERLRSGETLCGDGAWGTEFMARGLRPGDSPEALNLSDPEALAEVARLYVDAGADLITTNTFGGSPLKLEAYSLDDEAERINAAAVEVLRPVVAGGAYVSASIGPTGKLLTPYGDTEPERIAESFSRQIGAVIEAGADIVCIETMIDLTEAQLAIRAARAISSEIPIIATMTFDKTERGYFTTMGVPIDRACEGLVEAGADIVGSNCGNGIDRMLEIASEFVDRSSVPVVIQSNAGVPEIRSGEVVYPESPEFMAARVPQLIDLGVTIIGGCCGTGPDHIRALRTAIDGCRRQARE